MHALHDIPLTPSFDFLPRHVSIQLTSRKCVRKCWATRCYKWPWKPTKRRTNNKLFIRYGGIRTLYVFSRSEPVPFSSDNSKFYITTTSETRKTGGWSRYLWYLLHKRFSILMNDKCSGKRYLLANKLIEITKIPFLPTFLPKSQACDNYFWQMWYIFSVK